ncbi:preprotein translocase subunit YajC [Akkermansiaceae bacterium]|nr:preprotein translocase subunit YajC [Akkermansiaceae bacterium]MDA9830700.1 preprotein translocase subunit YajC [Akkermansiaceae bacterium]MDB4423648.1 preprotein translocase subunit YajC [bacterium]MDB4509506.1 preprotein translocase subunit YajC [Akkermansiaceae bacterium]
MTPILSILAAGEANPLTGTLPMIIIMIVMFYFLLIRPQKKQRQEQEARVAALKKGDKIVTIGGMHGIVHHVSKETITIKISEGVFVPFNKVAIASVEKSGKGDKKGEEKTSDEDSKEEKKA